MVAAASCPEDGIGDVAANQLGDGFDYTFFNADDQLIDDIQSVGFLLCLCSCGYGGEYSLQVVAVSSSALFFAALMTELAVIASVDFTSVRRLLPWLRSFSMPLPKLLGLNWLMSTC
jgi:hypothetical protein